MTFATLQWQRSANACFANVRGNLSVCLSRYTAYVPPVDGNTVHVAIPQVGVHTYSDRED